MSCLLFKIHESPSRVKTNIIRPQPRIPNFPGLNESYVATTLKAPSTELGALRDLSILQLEMPAMDSAKKLSIFRVEAWC
jgi:hypothetical protein